jgi:hypothetical protein
MTTAVAFVISGAPSAHAGTSAAPSRQLVTQVVGGRLTTRPAVAGPRTVRPATNTVGTSTSNAGYIADPPTALASFTSTVTVPTATCDSSVVNPFFTDDFVNGQLSGGGYAGSGLLLTVSCNGDTPTYQVQLVSDESSGPARTVTPGDVLSLTGTVSASAEKYVYKDVTAGAKATFSGAGLAGGDLQVTTQGGFGTSGGFPLFGTQTFGKLTVDKKTFGKLGVTGLSQVDNEGAVLISASSLTKNGKGFTLTYVTNQGDSSSG